MTTSRALAMQAQFEANKMSHGLLARHIVNQLALGHIALWLDQQDESIRSNAAHTACEAMWILRTLP